MRRIAVVTANNTTKIKLNNLKPGDQVSLSGLNITEAAFFKNGQAENTEPFNTIVSSEEGSIVYIDSPDDIKIIKRGTRKFYYASILSALGAVGVIAAAIIL